MAEYEKIHFENIYPIPTPTHDYTQFLPYQNSVRRLKDICKHIENFAFDLNNLSMLLNPQTGLQMGPLFLCTQPMKCHKLPHFIHDPKKSFIPQMYHILQDYGVFFLLASTIDHLDKGLLTRTNKYGQIVGQRMSWGEMEVAISRSVRARTDPIKRQIYLERLFRRIDAMKKLRDFDSVVCRGSWDQDHLDFYNFLSGLQNTMSTLSLLYQPINIDTTSYY